METTTIEAVDRPDDWRIDGEPTRENLNAAVVAMDSLRRLDTQWRAAATEEEKRSVVGEMAKVLASMLRRATPEFDLVMLRIARTELVRMREETPGMEESKWTDVLEQVLIKERPNRMEAILEAAGVDADAIDGVAANMRESTEGVDQGLLGVSPMPDADVVDDRDGATTPAEVDQLLADIVAMDNEYREAVANGSANEATGALGNTLEELRSALDGAEPTEDRRLLQGLRETLMGVRKIAMGEVSGDTRLTGGMSDRLYQDFLLAVITKCHASLMERVREMIANRI